MTNIIVPLFLLILAYSLISKRLRGSVVSSTMIFVAAGIILGSKTIGVIDISLDDAMVLLVAEIALVLILFSDASRINISAFKGSADMSLRLLVLGMPLTIAFGTVLALLFFTELSIAEAAIIGVILSPTDAGLGKAVVNSPLVPKKIRHTLNIESGLNDGLSVPFLLLFIAFAEAGTPSQSPQFWIRFGIEEIGIGILVGVGIGLIGSYLMKRSKEKEWMTGTSKRLVFAILALFLWIIADILGGSGFIAAFVGGLITAWMFGKVEEEYVTFIEAEGQLIILAVFFLFGGIIVSKFPDITAVVVVYALLSLTIIRMIPVAISLIGKHLHAQSITFMGWFGPRGLASIVLGLTLLDETTELKGIDQIIIIVMTTVLFSVFAHGISANPLIKIYNEKTNKLDEKSSEKAPVSEMPVRKAA